MNRYLKKFFQKCTCVNKTIEREIKHVKNDQRLSISIKPLKGGYKYVL